MLGEAFQRERPITDRQASVFRYGAAGCVAQYPSVPFSGCLLSLLLPTWWKGRDQDFHWNVPLLLQLGDFLESKFENNLAWYTEISFGPSVKRKNFHWWNLQDVPVLSHLNTYIKVYNWVNFICLTLLMPLITYWLFSKTGINSFYCQSMFIKLPGEILCF